MSFPDTGNPHRPLELPETGQSVASQPVPTWTSLSDTHQEFLMPTGGQSESRGVSRGHTSPPRPREETDDPDEQRTEVLLLTAIQPQNCS